MKCAIFAMLILLWFLLIPFSYFGIFNVWACAIYVHTSVRVLNVNVNYCVCLRLWRQRMESETTFPMGTIKYIVSCRILKKYIYPSNDLITDVLLNRHLHVIIFFFGNGQNLHSDIHRYWHRHRSSDAHKDTVQIELLFSTHCGMTYLFLISEQLLVAKNDVALSINGNLRKSLLLRKIRGKNTQNRVESLWFSLCAKQASYF